MTDREVLKQNAELLRGIVRSIDKNLDYSPVDDAQEGRFSLRLSSRNREGIVSLLTEDLRMAGQNAVRKNAIRQKIKSRRDHLSWEKGSRKCSNRPVGRRTNPSHPSLDARREEEDSIVR